MHAGVALDCLAGALLQECSKGSMRSYYGALQILTAAAASHAPSQQQAGLAQTLVDSIPRIVVQYAVGVHQPAAADQRNGIANASPAAEVRGQQYPSEAYIGLLAAAPAFLPRVFAELAAHADASQAAASEQDMQQRVLAATSTLCEVFADDRLKCSLVGMQAEAGQVVSVLGRLAAPLHAGESSRLKSLFTTFYGLPVNYAD